MNRFIRLGISDDTLRAAGVRCVSHLEAFNLCGIRYKSEHLEGIAYPYHNPATGNVTSWRVRRDHPEREADGTPIAKYLSSPDAKRFYFAPDATKDRLVDVRVDALIVKAESSVLALHDSCIRANKVPRLLIGLGGCWGWRGVIGKTTDADGARVDEKGPLPDFDRIAWTGRNVVLLFDSNALTNPSVQAARNALAAELKSRGADVYIAALPEFAGNGPDDFYAEYGDAKLWSLIDGARRWSAAAAKREKHTDSAGVLATSQASTIVQLAQEAWVELFHDDQVPYLSIRRDGHTETYKLRSRAARGYLVGLHLDATKKAPGSQGVADATTALEALALREAEQRVFVRIAATDGHIYLDLATDAWQVVDIDAQGWQLIVDPPVRFRRPKGLLALPTPVAGGSLRELKPFVNVEENRHLLLVCAVLLAWLRGRGPYPVLVLNGEQGVSKSTLARVLKATIDPNRAPLRSTPKEPRDLMIAAVHSHVMAFDNLSALPDWLSDAFCRLSTGGGFSTRMLFTDDEEQIFDAVRPVILNGIPDFATRQDLVGRAIFLTLPTISSTTRKAESTFWRSFAAAHQTILGALLDAVSVALRNEPTVVLDATPRMADFARWVVAAEPACWWRAGDFLATYTTTLDGDPVGNLVRGLLAPPLALPWSGTASQLLEALIERATQGRLPKDWPTRARDLADDLRRLAPALRQVGLDVQFSKTGKARTRTITVCRLEEGSLPASAASAASAQQELLSNPDDFRRTLLPDASSAPASAASAASSAANSQKDNDLYAADAADAEKPFGSSEEDGDASRF